MWLHYIFLWFHIILQSLISQRMYHLWDQTVTWNWLHLLQKQAEAKGFNALTTYIFVCMSFMAMAMLYYGLILFKLRRCSKIEDNEMNYEENGNKVFNTIIKLDRIMLVTYCIVFVIYNAGYFMTYYF